MSAPAPGMIPMNVPMSPVTGAMRKIFLRSSFFGRMFVSSTSISSFEKIVSIFSKAWLIAKSPIIIGM